MITGESAPREATVRAIAMRWSCEEVYSPPLRSLPPRMRLSSDSPSTNITSSSAPALTPIFSSISRIAFPLSLSLLESLLKPAIVLVPVHQAASSATIGNRSGQLLRSVSNAFRGALWTVMRPVWLTWHPRGAWPPGTSSLPLHSLPPSGHESATSSSSCEMLAPASIRMSMIEMSAWSDAVSIPESTVFPKRAPATMKLAAELQSPSMSKLAAEYFCPPFILKVIPVQSAQS